MARLTRLQKILADLAVAQGELRGGPPRDPWHAVLWENVVPPADEGRRDKAFAALQQATRLEAAAIAALPDPSLLAICGGGKLAAAQVARLRDCAARFASAGDPRDLVTLPAATAQKHLLAFPGVDLPVFHRLRLFAGEDGRCAFDGNGIRALLRLGYGAANGRPDADYDAVCAAAGDELDDDVEIRVEACLRLRRHGIDTCRRAPLCDACPVQHRCTSKRGENMH